MEITALLKEAVNSVKSVLDINRVIGEPINAGNATILPITKMIIGFASGGGEAEGKSIKTKELPIGGVGGGANILPIGFLIITPTSVKYLKTEGADTWTDILQKLVNYLS